MKVHLTLQSIFADSRRLLYRNQKFYILQTTLITSVVEMFFSSAGIKCHPSYLFASLNSWSPSFAMLFGLTLVSLFTLSAAGSPYYGRASSNCIGEISSLSDVSSAVKCTTVNIHSFTVPAGETFSLSLLDGTTVNVSEWYTLDAIWHNIFVLPRGGHTVR